MATIDQFLPNLLKWEGGYVNNPLDKGGATNRGITISTFRDYYGKAKTEQDLKRITAEQVRHIYKRGYWDAVGGDGIKSQAVANILADFAVNSGVSRAAKAVQSLVGVEVDGKVGPKTVAAINRKDARQLWADLRTYRETFYNKIVYNNPSQRAFLAGWMNRLHSWKFEQ